MSKRLTAVLLAAACLLTGCEGRSVNTKLVVSSMAVACDAVPMRAVLETVHEEQNETVTVQGNDLEEIFSAAERVSGKPLYLGALQSVVFSGIAGGSALRKQLFALLADGRIAPNTQIALCDDALSLYGDAVSGDTVTALLTRQFTDSRSCGLKELINLLDGEGRDGFLLWIEAVETGLQEAGVVPTGSADYTAPLRQSDLCRLLLCRTDEARLTLSAGDAEVSVLINRLAVSGVRFSRGETQVMLSAEAAVQSVSGTAPTRKALEAALKARLRQEMAQLEKTVMVDRRSDILGLAARAALSGASPDADILSQVIYLPRLVLRDPRGLLR